MMMIKYLSNTSRVLLLAAGFLLLAGLTPAFADMELLEEDTLSEVQAKSGLNLALRLQVGSNNNTSGSQLIITSTGSLNMTGVTIGNTAPDTNWSTTGYSELGTITEPFEIDTYRTAAGQYALRFTWPDTVADAGSYAADTSTPGIMATNVSWAGFNIGKLAIAGYHVQDPTFMEIYGGNDGLEGFISMRGRLDTAGYWDMSGVAHSTVAGTGAHALWLQNLIVSDNWSGGYTSAGTGGYRFYRSANTRMRVNVYTTSLWSTRTVLVITYPVDGTVSVGNSRIGYYSGATWVGTDYGPVLMLNTHIANPSTTGGIRIVMPVPVSYNTDNWP